MCAPTDRGPVFPPIARAAQDKSDAYSSVSGRADCFSYQPTFPEITCTRGDLSSPVRVALVGNSHAGEWLPAVEQIADRSHWHITTYLASDCALSEVPQHFTPSAVSVACTAWVRRTTARIVAGRYRLVVMSNKVSRSAVGHDLAGSWAPYERGYLTVLRALQRAHVRVVGIRDTPSPARQSIPTCLAQHPSDYARCDGSRRAWLPPEPLVPAVAALRDRQITVVDLTDHLCRPQVCPAIVGRVVVYFDASHLTATYARTLAPYLAVPLRAALAG
ncbi:MAG: SGNH hydrolase domain-containing protein [Jatrophihabitantaceae bacterium]